MTVTDMAKQLGVSTMTVYRRLKREGVSISEYRDESTNQLTAEGVSLIGALFSTTGATEATTGNATQMQRGAQPEAQQGAEIENAVLRAKLEGLEATNRLYSEQLAQANAELERLRGENARLLTLIEGQTRLLEDGTRRRGLFAWFRRRGD